MHGNNIPPSFQPPRYTYNDYKHWQGEWELICGYPFSLLPSLNKKHQNTNDNFTRLIGNFLVDKHCNCKIYFELDWIIDEETVVRPDSMIVRGNFETDFLTFPPTLILKVSSVSTWIKDRNTKMKLYEANGVKSYLLANPDKKILEPFELVSGRYIPKTDWSFQLTTDCNIIIDPEEIWYV